MQEKVQVRKEYLRAIVTMLWLNDKCAAEQEPEFRLLNYCSLRGLRDSTLDKLRGMSNENFAQRYNQLAEGAFSFLRQFPEEKIKSTLHEFDNLPKRKTNDTSSVSSYLLDKMTL